MGALPRSTLARVAAIRRRLNAAIVLRVVALVAAALLLGAGSFFVTYKAMAIEDPLTSYAPGAVTLAVVPVSFLIMLAMTSVPRLFGDRDAAVLYDVATGGTGLALSIAECGGCDDTWDDRLAEDDEELARAGLPVRLRLRDIVRPLGVPLLFLLGAIVVPGRKPETKRPDFALRRAVSEAKDAAEALAEAEFLEPEELEAVREELERIEERENESDTAAWEAVDAVDERIASRVQSAADALAWTMEAAEALSETPTDTVSREELEAALSRLAETGALTDVARQLGGGAGGGMSLPSDPGELARALRQLDDSLCKSAGKLCKSASGCRGSSAQQALRDLAEYVDSRMSNRPGMPDLYLAEGDGQGQCQGEGPPGGNRPGTGGINRGRGDAPMLWGKPTEEEGAAFTSHELPQGEIDPAHSTTVAVRYATPEVTGDRAGGASGAAAGEGVGEASGGTRLSPARREIVKRYFSEQ